MNRTTLFHTKVLTPVLVLGLSAALADAGFSGHAAPEAIAAEMRQQTAWAKQHLLEAKSVAPFSFTYGGRASSDLLRAWPAGTERRQIARARIEHGRRWSDPATGLQVRCVAVQYADYPVVEWTVYFKNTGTSDTPILENLQGLDTSFQRGAKGEFVLHGIKGDFCTADSYEPYQHTLSPNWRKDFSPPVYSGKSCDGPDGWPYYNLQMPGGGVILAVGWPGQWASAFTRDAVRGLRITAGQQRTHLVLKPGEEIRTPLIALLFWQGDDVVRAQNLWRRWFIAHNLARTHGQTQPAVTQIQVDGSVANIAGVKAFLDAGIKPDICWRDAGGTRESVWFKVGPDPLPYQSPGMIWLNSGTWEVDEKKFPQGFKPFSDWVRSNGMQFLLWFEPERVGDTNSWLAKNHPEWLLPGSSHGSILDLGNPTALNWLVNHIDSMIKTQGLDWYREDMNGEGPLPTWRKNDAENRQGIAENFYVQGHLAFWDELRRRHPGLRIDSCASGGRRNDLESMRRAVPLLRSDFQFPDMNGVVEGNQGHTHGLSSWLPFQGTGCYLYDAYSFRSFYLTSFGMGGLSPENVAAQKQAYAECKRIAPMMLGDYYPLTPYNREAGRWIAWQFNRPEQRDGFVQAFRRRECPEVRMTFHLNGLDPSVRYEITNFDIAGTTVASGKKLMKEGFTLEIKDRPGAAIVMYRAVK